MTRDFEKASSLLKIIKQCKTVDCANLFKHLDIKGIELLCRLLFLIVRGDLELLPKVVLRLKKKIKHYLADIKRLITPPRHLKDIVQKRRILQRVGIINILTSIAKAVEPAINRMLSN